jgi:hypothetical protein
MIRRPRFPIPSCPITGPLIEVPRHVPNDAMSNGNIIQVAQAKAAMTLLSSARLLAAASLAVL